MPDCQSSLPFARSKHMSVRRFSFSTAWATNTRSPQTIGEELPGPGNSTRQRTFSLLLHLSGRFSSNETPLPSGPRQFGQLLVNAGTVIEMVTAISKPDASDVFMLIELLTNMRETATKSARIFPGSCQSNRISQAVLKRNLTPRFLPGRAGARGR